MAYTIKREDLAGKLSGYNAIVQAGLDSGWSCFLKSGCNRLEDLEPSEKDYLFKSATSYMMAGDPVLIDRANQYVEAA